MTFDYGLVNLRPPCRLSRGSPQGHIPTTGSPPIRAQCGDSRGREDHYPARGCDLELPAAEAARTAAALRARPDLVSELNWHKAKIATQLQNIQTLKDYCTQLAGRIGPS